MSSIPTIALLKCPACGAADSSDFALAEGVTLRRCQACGAVFAPEYADPDAVFREGYFEGETGEFGIDLRHPRWQDFLGEVGRRRCELIERESGGPGRMLDVGCGAGEITAVAKGRGWDVIGVELMPDAASAARSAGLDVRTGTLETVDLEGIKFDVACAFHVLEHMVDAPALLRSMAANVRAGGLVAVETPNFDGALRRRFGKDWPHLRPLEHLTHFTPATMEATLARAGLEPVRVVSVSYRYSAGTIEEAAVGVGRPDFAKPLAKIPRPVALALLGLLKRRQERRGRGSGVFGLARVPQ